MININFIELVIISISLSMDAVAISICKGLSIKNLNKKSILIISGYFSAFQALMPIVGYILGATFEKYSVSIDHWVAFLLLLIIGINMLRNISNNNLNDNIDFLSMLPLALATSIDALAVGVTLAFLDSNIFISSLVIGIVTFILTFAGAIIGNKFGNKYEKLSQILGGIILIMLSFKILIEHLNLL